MARPARVRGAIASAALLLSVTVAAVAPTPAAAALTPTDTPEPSPFGTATAVRDIDGDGRADLLSSTGATLVVLRGSATGSLAAVTSTPFAAGQAATSPTVLLDVDEDGAPDAVFGLRTCTPHPLNPAACTPGSSTFGIGWARNLGNGSFGAAASAAALAQPAAVLNAGDFTGDGLVDLAMPSPGGTISLLTNTGTAFGAPQDFVFTHGAYTLSPGTRAQVVADANGDGIDDLVLHYRVFDIDSNGFDGLGVLLGGPTPTAVDNGQLLSAGIPSPYGWDQNWVHVGDADGDGRTDLFVVDYDAALGQNLLYFHANASGIYDAPVVLAVDVAYFPANADVQVGDLDGDGHEDVAYLAYVDSSYATELRVGSGNGDGTFDPPTAVGVGFYGSMLRLGDFDGDGALDVHVQRYDAAFNVFRTVLRSGAAVDPDADHDGVLDIIDPDRGLGTSPAGAFDDLGGTSGRLTNANGLTVQVGDAATPDGVRVVVGPGTGSASFTVCGFTLRLTAGSDAVLTCGSVTARVTTGSAVVDLPGGGTATIPAGAVARVDRTPTGEATVVVTTGVITVTGVDGTTSTLNPGPARTLCSGRVPTIVGTSGADTIKGTNGADVILALGGNDKIEAGAGDDVICAGDGDDKIEAGDGNDLVDAGRGNDKIEGGSGNDTLAGGEGNDKIEGGAGTNVIDGGPGTDKCEGGQNPTACE